MNSKETVCAVVVTYNRKGLLIECLEAILRQTRPVQAIYIIDNHSTDGTPELLLEKGYIGELPPSSLTEPWEKEFSIPNMTDFQPVKIHYVRMHQNTGGAGGFYEGVKRAYEKGYDWLWLMDDDVEPKVDCLEALISFSSKAGAYIACPLVLSVNGRIQCYHHKQIKSFFREAHVVECKHVSEIRFDFKNLDANAFLGILINKKVISDIGLPLKELFIWGDDTEYTYRARKNGYKIYLLYDSQVLHKDGGYEFKRIIDDKNAWKIYYSYRNKVYVSGLYRDYVSVVYWLMRGLFSFLKNRNVRIYTNKLKGAIDGLKMLIKLKM